VRLWVVGVVGRGGEFGIDRGTATRLVCGGEGTGGSPGWADGARDAGGAGRRRAEAVAVGHEA